MKRNIILSKRAKNKLEKLLEYLESEWSERIKNDFIKKLDHSIQIIKSNPESFPKTTIIKGLHKCVVTKQNTIYYRIKNSNIEIVTIFDTRQNPKKLTEKLK